MMTVWIWRSSLFGRKRETARKVTDRGLSRARPLGENQDFLIVFQRLS